jgi:hypothetical protein
MGLSTKKTKSTTNQNTTANVTPTNLPGIDTQVSGLAGRIGDTFKTLDPMSLVPNADPLQTQAGQGAANLTTNPGYGQASDILRGVAGAGPQSVHSASLLDNLQNYMSPYTKDVVDTSLADYDQGAGYTRAQNQLSLAGDTTFGGSGGAIQTSLSNDNIDRGRGALSAQLRDQAFNTGAGLSAQDAGFRQQASLANASLAEQALARQGAAAGGLADVAGAQGTDQRANIDAQSRMGDILRQIAAAKGLAPVTGLGLESSLLNGLPLDLFKGSNATGSLSGTSTTKESGASLSDWVSQLGALATAAAVASDIRLKRDIVKLYERPDGLGVYLFRYLWSPIRYVGVMAQEVLKVKPEAVVTMPNGFLAVQYGKL